MNFIDLMKPYLIGSVILMPMWAPSPSWVKGSRVKGASIIKKATNYRSFTLRVKKLFKTLRILLTTLTVLIDINKKNHTKMQNWIAFVLNYEFNIPKHQKTKNPNIIKRVIENKYFFPVISGICHEIAAKCRRSKLLSQCNCRKF